MRNIPVVTRLWAFFTISPVFPAAAAVTTQPEKGSPNPQPGSGPAPQQPTGALR